MNPLQSLTQGAPASAVILGITIVASLAGLKWPALIARSVFRPHWFLPRREFGTAITNAFMHADLSHLLFNAFTFWAFAFTLERVIGSASFVALYVVGMLTSDAGTWLAHRREPEYRTLGASGAILAVLFAGIVYAPGSSIFILPIPVPIPAPWFALGYLAYSYFASRRSVGRINHDAHFSGALAGLAFVAATDWEALQRAVHSVLR
jgi:membrane associated rhomboid family serine protease